MATTLTQYEKAKCKLKSSLVVVLSKLYINTVHVCFLIFIKISLVKLKKIIFFTRNNDKISLKKKLENFN